MDGACVHHPFLQLAWGEPRTTEILITALFSARYGWWNERLATDAAFVRATFNLCRANLLAMAAIRKAAPNAAFVQSESFEHTHPAGPELIAEATFHNERRFLPLDLTYGHPVSTALRDYLIAHGMTTDEWAFFQTWRRPPNCVLGADYYATNEPLLRPGGVTGPAGDWLGFAAVAREYYNRYRLPLMVTETNRAEADGAVGWLHKQWHGLLWLRREGVPVIGFTWYSLTDQMDWDTALREDARRVNAVGLYDLDRRSRAVGREYQQLVQEWRSTLVADAGAYRAA